MTSLQQAADAILRTKVRKSLEAWLREQAKTGDSYETVARRLFTVTDEAVQISYQTAKRWMEELGERAAA